MIPKLDRPTPALPASYFWTWDHSTNWVLDDPGNQTSGCHNRYLKQPQTYLEDYRRLTDLAANIGVKGVLIWGFLRDSHGGIDAGKKLADNAAAKGVAIMPGVGTTWYGGIYYEGDHPFNIETFVRKHPSARMVGEKGEPLDQGACPSHPAYLDWLREGLNWLHDEFAIGGTNLENGDFLVCHCDRCKSHGETWPADDPDFFRLQAMSYVPALQIIGDRLDDTLTTYATYTGFEPLDAEDATVDHMMGSMACRRPAMFDRADPRGICQWTLSGMVRAEPLTLTTYLDDGEPEAMYDNPRWPTGLTPPSAHSAGFLHQASQWGGLPKGTGRYQQIVSTIKEACLRAYRAGFDGLSIHGEVSDTYVPWALNYLAFSHFTHWPDDTLRGFGRNTIGPVLGSDELGEQFAEVLAHWDSGSLTDEHRKLAQDRNEQYTGEVAAGKREALTPWRMWSWLARVANGPVENETASFD